MNRSARFSVVAASMIVLLTLATGCNKLKARDQLNKGVQAFKSAKYEDAINHFQQAVQLDPTLPMARAYLATAYAQQVIPNLETPENLKNAQLAIQQFQQVLDKEPNDLNSLKGIAQLYFSLNKFDQARDYQKKVIAVDPKDPEAHYTIGVIDWTIAYKNAIPVRKSLGLQDNGDAIKDKKACADLQTQNAPLIQEGLDYLNQSVQLRPNYDAAMAYINLLYRRKADIECGDDDARKADLDQANQWAEKSMGARKANEAKQSRQTQGGIVLDNK
ncbi:MAG TPA: tetratricopeptide repeat protein [Acidobacteriaceae bacterium]|jgi:tetratricopeptide (TPR) repeat protein|nr:tetratricopeptide repeat protein [Acidobacteriaceae bacterium]